IDQYHEYHRLYHLLITDSFIKDPSVGDKESEYCQNPRGIPGGAKTCAEGALHHAEYPLERELFPGHRSCGGAADSGRRAVWDGAGKAKNHRDDHSDQPDPYAAGLWPFAGGTGGNRKVPDRLCGGADSETALDDAGYEFYQ